MISYPSINFANTDSNLKISSNYLSAFAEDGEDGNDSEDNIKTTDNTDNQNNDNSGDHTKDNANNDTQSENKVKANDKSKNDNNENESKDNTHDKSKDNPDNRNKDNTDDKSKNDNNENEKDNQNKTEIEVEVKNDKAKVKIHLNGDEYRFLVKDTSESAIIAAITNKTGLTEEQIRADWDFQVENNSKDSENNSKSSENIVKHENQAKETADNTVQQLQQKIDQLEQRLQDLLNKFETGKYFGTVTNADPTPDSYTASFSGTATSLDDASLTSNVSGDIYLQSITTGKDSFKLRITGGEILVGDTFYDVIFGKARLASSDGSTSMIVLGQIMDDKGNVSTIRLTLDTTSTLSGNFGADPVPFSIDASKSKIAKQWGIDATGDFSLV